MFFTMKYFAQKQFFLLRWPLEAKPLTLGQIWRHIGNGEFHSISNAVFGFALAIILSFRNNGGFSKRCLTIAKKNSKIWPVFGPGCHNFDLSEKLTASFVIIYDEFLTFFFRFSLRPIGAEIDGGVFKQLPPVGGGKSGAPVGRGLRAIKGLKEVKFQNSKC